MPNIHCEELIRELFEQMPSAGSDGYFETASALLTAAADIEEPFCKAAAHFYMAFHCFRKGELEKSIQEGIQCLALSEESDITEYSIKSCNLLGVCYNMCFNYFSGLDYFLKAYYLCEEIKDFPFQLKVLNNIGNMFFYIDDYADALHYYQYALEMDIVRNCNTSAVSRCNIICNMIWCNISLNQQEEAAAITKENQQALEQWAPDLLYLTQTARRALNAFSSQNTEEAREAVSELISCSDQSSNYEQVFCAFNRVRDILSWIQDRELYQDFLSHLNTVTGHISDFSYRIHYFDELIQYSRKYSDTANYVKALEEYHELAQSNSVSRKDTFINSLALKIELERMVHERVHILKKSNRYKILSQTDGLTQILNRITAEARIKSSLHSLLKTRYSVLLLFDIDHFKLINDNFGHIYGDFVLKKTAQAMKNSFRARDILGRFGGDEFIVFMRSVADTSTAAEEACTERISRLLNSMKELMPEIEFEVTLSIGVLILSGPQTDFDHLYREADSALYAAKHGGRNQACIKFLDKNT